MTDTPPDRLSNDPDSPFYDEALLERGIGIRFAGQERTNVEEYCVSEGWIRVAAGKALDRKGKPLTIKLKGPVEAVFSGVQRDVQPLILRSERSERPEDGRRHGSCAMVRAPRFAWPSPEAENVDGYARPPARTSPRRAPS